MYGLHKFTIYFGLFSSDICWNYQYLKSMIVFINDLVVLTDLYYNRELLLSWQLKILCVGIKISYYAIKIFTWELSI